MATAEFASQVRPEELYIDLTKRALTGLLFGETEVGLVAPVSPAKKLIASLLHRIGFGLARVRQVTNEERAGGLIWPWQGLTMVGLKRLDNLQRCIEQVLHDDVRGDLIETGVWRGGACIFMRGVLVAYAVTDRSVWAADSFEGVPRSTHPNDAGVDLSVGVLPVLAVPLEQVQELFSRYGLLDAQVRFLKGWFKQTLKDAPIERLALLRLDGDLYESTMDTLVPLYDKVSPGGFVIVDDYESTPGARHDDCYGRVVAHTRDRDQAWVEAKALRDHYRSIGNLFTGRLIP